MLARALPLAFIAASAFALPGALAQDDDVVLQDSDDDDDQDDDDDDEDDDDEDDDDDDDDDGESESGNPDDPAKKKDKDGKDKEPKRPIDKESPEALALSEMLNVEPNYGKDDKRVELTYLFPGEVELEDFASQGFDRIEADGSLLLASGSQRPGLFLHNLNMKGEYEVELECSVEWMAPSTQVVFLFGDGKSGGMWGNGWCKRTSRGYKPVSKKVARYVNDTRSKYNASRTVKVHFKVGSGKVSCKINGVKAGDTKKLKKLDGRIGIYCKNVRLRVNRISIKGEIDASKL